MILKYDIKTVRPGLHIANRPTLHKNKKKLKKKKKRESASQTDWLKSHCHDQLGFQWLPIKWLQGGDCFYWIQQTDSFLQVYLQRSGVRVPGCGDVPLFSAGAGGCCH